MLKYSNFVLPLIGQSFDIKFWRYFYFQLLVFLKNSRIFHIWNIFYVKTVLLLEKIRNIFCTADFL